MTNLFLQLGAPFLLAIPTWLVLLASINIAYARVTQRAWFLDLTLEGNYALHRGNPRDAYRIGRTSKLFARKFGSKQDPATLHEVQLADLMLDKLTAHDVRTFSNTLSAHGVAI